MSSINDLPPEMICELFKHLSPRDLVVCSMVNKRWQSLYSGIKLYRVAAIAKRFSDCLDNWSYPDRRIEDQELCPPELFHRLIDQPLLSNLKYLALCGLSSDFDLDKLSGLLTNNNQLLHLELNVAFSSQVNLHLKLPKLRILAFHSPNELCSLSVDCPELNVLLYHKPSFNRGLLEVKHPETIRKLDTNLNPNELALFKNIEYLVIQDCFLESVRNILSSLPRLKELHFNEGMSWVFRTRYSRNRVEELTLEEFLNDAKKRNGTDFQFRYGQEKRYLENRIRHRKSEHV